MLVLKVAPGHRLRITHGETEVWLTQLVNHRIALDSGETFPLAVDESFVVRMDGLELEIVQLPNHRLGFSGDVRCEIVREEVLLREDRDESHSE